MGGVTSPAHWDAVYSTDRLDRLGWYEPVPSTLELVTAYSTPDDAVIDVGGGTSSLTLELARRGHRDLAVLDISERALDATRLALGEHADVVTLISADVTRWTPSRRWRLWHDRAVFHFLVDPADRDTYRAAAAAAIEPGGILIVATFAPDGPERCAGLDVCRYDVESLAAEFVPEFELLEGHRLDPAGPDGDQRPYVGVVLRRVGSN